MTGSPDAGCPRTPLRGLGPARRYEPSQEPFCVAYGTATSLAAAEYRPVSTLRRASFSVSIGQSVSQKDLTE